MGELTANAMSTYNNDYVDVTVTREQCMYLPYDLAKKALEYFSRGLINDRHEIKVRLTAEQAREYHSNIHRNQYFVQGYGGVHISNKYDGMSAYRQIEIEKQRALHMMQKEQAYKDMFGEHAILLPEEKEEILEEVMIVKVQKEVKINTNLIEL
jgi:hypothetical protein